MANSYLSRTISSSPTNPDKFTISMWVKRSKLGSEQAIMGQYASANFRGKIDFLSDDRIEYIQKNDGNTTANLITTRKFRDTSAWYHLVYQFDTSQGTSSNRIKLYVNGVQETAFDTASYPAQDLDMRLNQASGTLNIGQDGNSANYFEGYISHIALADGQTYAPTSFGETDSTSGIWKFKSPSGITWGDDGFHLKMENSGNLGLDSSGQTNNFTVNGTLKQTLDTPSNVYCTINPLVRNQVTLTTNNLTVRSPSTNWMGIPASMGVTKGKWYWEYKLALGNSWSQCGVMSSRPTGGYNGIYSTYVGNLEGGMALNSGNGDIYNNGSSGTTWFSGGLAEYDIIGVALDADNNKCYWSKNGSWGNSSNPATGTNGQTLGSNFTDYKPYFPAFSVHNCIVTINFGNGYLGASAISSAGSNGNGSLFEYDVPSGYYALTTKNINTYG